MKSIITAQLFAIKALIPNYQLRSFAKMKNVAWLGVLLVLLSGPSEQQSNYQHVKDDQTVKFLKKIVEIAKNNQHQLSKLGLEKDNDESDLTLNRYKKRLFLHNLNQQKKLLLENKRQQNELQNHFYDVLKQNRLQDRPKQLLEQYFFKNQKDLSKNILLNREKERQQRILQQLSQQERHHNYHKERLQNFFDLHRHPEQDLDQHNYLKRLLKKVLQESYQEDRSYIPVLYFHQSDKLPNIVPKDLEHDLEYDTYTHMPEFEPEPIEYHQSTEEDQSSHNSQEGIHVNCSHHSHLPSHPSKEASKEADQFEYSDSEEDSPPKLSKLQLENNQKTIKDIRTKTPLQLKLRTSNVVSKNNKELLPHENGNKLLDIMKRVDSAKILSPHRYNRLSEPSHSSRKSVPLEHLLNLSYNADRLSPALYPRLETFSLTEYLKKILPNYSN